MNFESDSLAARRRKVVFYGRVSTEMEAQIAALKNQIIWYQQLAERHPEWTVVTMYEDEGISGRSINNRPGFMKMLTDAKKRKFDLIVTREVSRFARNTVDALVVTRKLKTYGVEVYFVNDDIWTMSGDGELRLTIMASLAQEESRKFSERVRAGIKIAQGKGRYFTGWRPYGYTNDSANKTLVVREDEAEVVRRIYAMHAAGIGSTSIAKRLTEERIPNYAGEFQWKEGQVYDILRNPIYKGYKTTNKEHVSDYLSQTIIKHDRSEYVYVKCDFEPIIPEQEWEACQRRLKRASAFLDGGVSEAYLYGKSESRDKWACRMFCACGARMRAASRNKAHEANYLCYRKLKSRRADKSKPMSMSMIYINTSDDERLFKQLNYFSPPLLLLFFVRSGLNFDLDAIFSSSDHIGSASLLAVGVVYFVTRILGKYSGAFLGCLLARKNKKVRNNLGLALIPQAGVAIGLAAMGARTLGGAMGDALETIILASSVLYELIGPACAKLSLYLSGSYSNRLDDIVTETVKCDEHEPENEVERLIRQIQAIQKELPAHNDPFLEDEQAYDEAAYEHYALTGYPQVSYQNTRRKADIWTL